MITSSGISSPIRKQIDLFDYLLPDGEDSVEIRSHLRSRDFLGEELKRAREIGSTPWDPGFLMFTIYHGAPDCLPDDKGSYIASERFFSSPLPFYFAETRACRRITSKRCVSFIARTPVLLTGSLLSRPLISRLCQSFQSEGLHPRCYSATRSLCFSDKIIKRCND